MGMRNSHTRPVPFNFLNETRMRIILNKWDEVGMEATCPVAILIHACNLHRVTIQG